MLEAGGKLRSIYVPLIECSSFGTSVSTFKAIAVVHQPSALSFRPKNLFSVFWPFSAPLDVLHTELRLFKTTGL